MAALGRKVGREMSKDTITIHIGGLAKPLLEQVIEQGYRFRDSRDCAKFEDYIHQTTRLMFASLVTRTEANKIFERIVKGVKKAIERVE